MDCRFITKPHQILFYFFLRIKPQPHQNQSLNRRLHASLGKSTVARALSPFLSFLTVLPSDAGRAFESRRASTPPFLQLVAPLRCAPTPNCWRRFGGKVVAAQKRGRRASPSPSFELVGSGRAGGCRRARTRKVVVPSTQQRQRPKTSRMSAGNNPTACQARRMMTKRTGGIVQY